MILERRLSLKAGRNWLLLGPRRVGKSTFLRAHFAEAEWIDLLKTDVFFEYRSRPAILRERFAEGGGTIVIDEVQLIPELLREVHWLIENSRRRFVLCGSSARKLRRGGVTNLAGRLSAARLHPLTASEAPDLKLAERLQHGSLPPVVFSTDPERELRSYCGEYLKEEVQAEGLVRNLPAFARFLESAALANGELLSYASAARDCGVALKTVREYFQILVDTLLGHFLEPWTKSRKRRAILMPKFYFFDCGVPNTLLGRRLSPKTPEFGKAFEQMMVLEAMAARDYEGKLDRLTYWRSASGFEVDLLIDSHTACEFKTGTVSMRDAAGILALAEDLKLKNRWIVGLEERPRRLEAGVVVLPWREFVERLRSGDFSTSRSGYT